MITLVIGQDVDARRLLSSDRTSYPTVADIAYAAGFSALSYFHRSFRRRLGITPAEYREHAGALWGWLRTSGGIARRLRLSPILAIDAPAAAPNLTF